jgi:hypothetical protein
MMNQPIGDFPLTVSGQTATIGQVTTSSYTWPYGDHQINWGFPTSYSCNDKGRAAITIVKKLQEKKLIELKTAKQAIEAIDAVLESL